MIVKEVKLNNEAGLQSKMAAVFIQKASNYKSRIWIESNERKLMRKASWVFCRLEFTRAQKLP